MDRYDFTDKQKSEIGETLVGFWGGHFQTGLRSVIGENSKIPYVAVQMAKDGKFRFFDFLRDGTVLIGE